MSKILKNNKITLVISIIAISSIIKYRRNILNLLTTKLSNFYNYLIKKNFDYITYDNLSNATSVIDYEDEIETREREYYDGRPTSYYDYNNNDY